MSPRRTMVDPVRGVFDVDWALFGEFSRALALKVARDYEPGVVLGIVHAGVVPGAVVSAILGAEFHSLHISRKDSTGVRETPSIFGQVTPEVRGRRVLIVDETCDTGDTLRLALNAVRNAGAADVRTAVGFKTGPYEPDYYALYTESTFVLPWDKEILDGGALVPNPKYESPYR